MRLWLFSPGLLRSSGGSSSRRFRKRQSGLFLVDRRRIAHPERARPVPSDQPHEIAAERLRKPDNGVDSNGTSARSALDGAYRATRITCAKPELVLGHATRLAYHSDARRDHAGDLRVAVRLVPDAGFQVLADGE